jgi:hypothetical protein
MAEPVIDEEALAVAHKAIEDALVDFRDRRISVLDRGNGFVIRERDGRRSDIMRLGTREGLRIGLKAYLRAVQERRDG